VRFIFTFAILFLFFVILFSFACKNKENNTIEFYRKPQSVTYEVWYKGWQDTFKFVTRDYDTGIPYILDTSRNFLFFFDNMLDLYKLNIETGILLDSVDLISRYTYRMAPERNKLLYAYPALFFYHETVLHLDMGLNLKAKYLDSINRELENRYPETLPFGLDLDSVNIILPNKLWVRLNDYNGCTEEMIFGVSVPMEPPVIHSTYIVR